MIRDQGLVAAEKVRAEIAEIERQAMSEPGWLEYLAQCSDKGRESAMSAALSDKPTTFERWRALRTTLSELLR